MCILCTIQKWSRCVATMLPWLVFPLIGLWALSQLLPPAFRFEITSPRLACVFVLLVTLFWYEVLMPQLSAWRVRRNARLEEKARLEAIEFDKLRKTATRRCRNCSTTYKDQNPPGGRFMCSYCGHVSKRPVLDFPLAPGMQITNTLAGMKGHHWRMCLGRGWVCRHDWLDNGNWASGSYVGKSTRWRRASDGVFPADNLCFAEKSYFWVLMFFSRILNAFFMGMRWLWRKVFRISASGDESCSLTERSSTKRFENGTNLHESKGEKARRKAEEKRQARLEKELLEEEEKKQREEVARLIEERRKQRDMNVVEGGRDRVKASVYGKDKNIKREGQKKRQERRKDKDKASNKSNSDVEELERRGLKDCDRRGDLEKRNGAEAVKSHLVEGGHVVKSNTASSSNKGNSGRKYLDRMKGTLLYPTKAFSGGSFFGKVGNTTAAIALKENKPSGVTNVVHTSLNRRDLYPPEKATERADANGSFHNPARVDLQPVAAPKKSWQQLFTRTPAISTSSNISVISKPISNLQVDGRATLPTNPSVMPYRLRQGSPIPRVPFASADGSSSPCVPESPRKFLPKEQDIFEDPCYNPDPVSLLGPVSESLDKFPLDVGTVIKDLGFERPYALKNMLASNDIARPPPIESPMSKVRGFQNVHRPEDFQVPSNDKGIWQMWNSAPLGPDSLSLVSGVTGWALTPSEVNRGSGNGMVHSSESNGRFAGANGSADLDKWLQDAFYPPLPGNEQDFSQVKSNYPTQAAGGSSLISFDKPPTSCWPKKERCLQGSGECSSMGSSCFGGSSSIGSSHPQHGEQLSPWSYQ